jgi:RES domain-containing protein
VNRLENRTCCAQAARGVDQGAAFLQGDFFRSVAFRYFHPDDVISGEGTRLHGGRFVPVGVRAVYASPEEETALREVTSCKSALGGRSQINVGEYPRMTYVLSVGSCRDASIGAGKRRQALSWAGVFCFAGVG